MVEKNSDNQLNQPISRLDQRRETHKAIIEALKNQLRKSRKDFLIYRDETGYNLPAPQKKIFDGVMTLRYYRLYPTQIADVIAEGIKFQTANIRKTCQKMWEDNKLQEGKNDIYLTVKVLSADYVPESVWNFIKTYPDLFNYPSIQKLIAEAEKKKDRPYNNDKYRENYKKLLENLCEDLRRNRKQYLDSPDTGGQNVNFANLKMLVTPQNYKDYPIQIADILYEGVKFPHEDVRDFCQQFVGESLKKGIKDFYFHVKTLSGDYVPNQEWRFLDEYSELLLEIQDILMPLIKAKNDKGRTENPEINELYKRVKAKFSARH